MSIILLSIAVSSIGQDKTTKDYSLENDQWKLANLMVERGVPGNEAVTKHNDNPVIAHHSDAPFSVTNLPDYGDGCMIPEISKPYAFDPPEMVFEPY